MLLPLTPSIFTHSLHTKLCVFSFSLTHQVQFVMPKYSWICGISLKYDQLTRGYILKKKKVFPSSRNYPLSIASPLPAVCGRHCFLVVINSGSVLLLYLFACLYWPLLPQWSLNLERKEGYVNVPFMAEHFAVSILCTLASWRCLCQSQCSAKRSFSNKSWEILWVWANKRISGQI